jgi:hypothetical protein
LGKTKWPTEIKKLSLSLSLDDSFENKKSALNLINEEAIQVFRREWKGKGEKNVHKG